MKYPTKKVKYSGTAKVWLGDTMVYMPDGTVKTLHETFAGAATSKNDGIIPDEVEFYVLKEP